MWLGIFLIMKKILFLPLLFFFALSCNKDSRQDWTGMEYFTFKIEGRVTDASGQALSGIRVEALGQQTATRSDGTYKIEGTGGNVTAVFVNFTDMDGEDGGGFFMGTSLSVELDYVTGRHGPYLGLFGKSGVDAVMTSGTLPIVPSVPVDTI